MFLWLCFSTILWASPKQKITLHDGSVIVGELTDFDGQFYTFSTEFLGNIKLPVEKVRSLHTMTEREFSNSAAMTTQLSNSISNNTNTSFSLQTNQRQSTVRIPKEPRSPREPISPDVANMQLYESSYQNNTSQTPNTSLIYGVNNSTNQQTITDMQNMMMSDNQMMGLIIGMQNDPELAKILNNPQLMLYMSTGNIEELQKSPELKKLMSKPEVQQLMQMMQQ